MDELATVIRRFYRHELSIRRFYASDPDFRELCEHYGIAVAALERWIEDPPRAEEYRQIVREMEEEISKYLDKHQRPLSKSDRS